MEQLFRRRIRSYISPHRVSSVALRNSWSMETIIDHRRTPFADINRRGYHCTISWIVFCALVCAPSPKFSPTQSPDRQIIWTNDGDPAVSRTDQLLFIAADVVGQLQLYKCIGLVSFRGKSSLGDGRALNIVVSVSRTFLYFHTRNQISVTL